MARGRMLNKAISKDEAVNSLKSPESQLIFTWLIAHLDKNGCYYGDPFAIKSLVFHLNSFITVKKIAKSLAEFQSKDLIIRYVIGNIPYIFYPKFDKNQPYLRKDREGGSDIPPYVGLPDFTPSTCLTEIGKVSGNLPSNCRTEVLSTNTNTNVLVEGEREGPSSSGVNIFSLFENCIGLVPSALVEELKDAEAHYLPGDLTYAFKEAKDNKKCSWGYVKGILERREKEGIGEKARGNSQRDRAEELAASVGKPLFNKFANGDPSVGKPLPSKF